MLFQSTLPRGSDTLRDLSETLGKISIHAPSRERLPVPFSKACIIHISIHAPSRERLSKQNAKLQAEVISIHAPSRERPYILLCTLAVLNAFQSTLPRGSDQRKFRYNTSVSKFQSTLPRGSDNSGRADGLERPYFNPRSLAGATTTVTLD